MKTHLIIVLFFLSTISLAYDNVTMRRLGELNGIDNFFAPVNDVTSRITYYNFGNDFIRVENGKIQCFDTAFVKKWEHNIDESLDLNVKYRFLFCSTPQFFYAVHYFSPNGQHGSMKLYCINKKGEIIERDLNSDYDILACYGIEASEDTVQLICYVSTGKKFELEDRTFECTQAICLNYTSSLIPAGKQFSLDVDTTSYKNYIFWRYQGKVDNNYLFTTIHDGDSENSSGFAESIFVNDAGVVVSTNKYQNAEIFYKVFFRKDFYNTSTYEVLTDKDYGPLRTSLNYGVNILEIKKGAISSGNIIEKINALTKFKYGIEYEFALEDIFADPINDGLVVCFDQRGYHKFFSVHFDNELRLTNIQCIKSIESTHGIKMASNFSLIAVEPVKSWGTPSPSHKTNAFDIIYDKANGAFKGTQQFSILNFENFQMLFEDNLKLGETWGYRIEI